MTNLRQIITDLGYTPDDLALRWPPSKPLKKHSRRRWVNMNLKNPSQLFIDAVAGLPTKPGNTRGGFTV